MAALKPKPPTAPSPATPGIAASSPATASPATSFPATFGPRPRSQSAPPERRMTTIAQREAFPASFRSVLTRGVLPPSATGSSQLSADAHPHSVVFVNRLDPRNPQPAVDRAMTAPHQGVVGVTAERAGAPLESMGGQLTDSGRREANRRARTSMMVAARLPDYPAHQGTLATHPRAMENPFGGGHIFPDLALGRHREGGAGVWEHRRGAIPPQHMTAVSVPPAMVAEARRIAPSHVKVFSAPRTSFAASVPGSTVPEQITAPDHRIMMKAQLAHEPMDFHAVRTDPRRKRSASLPPRSKP